MRISLRYWIVLLLLPLSGAHLARAQGVTPLVFEPAQAPGTSGQVSDPTIQPFVAPGMPAPILMWAPIDLEGNGRPDAVVCHGSFPPSPDVKGPCRVLRPQPNGSLVDVTRQLFGAGALPSATHPREIVSGDFNHDGRADIFVAAHGYDTSPFSGETNLLLLSNANGTYTDRSATLPQAPDFTHSACVGDINGDRNLDIFVNNWGGNGAPVGPYFLMGRGDGTFTQKITGLPASIGWGGSDEKFASCLLVDLDGDLYPDLALGTTNTAARNIVLFNDGTGEFNRRPRLELPDGPLPQGNRLVLDIVSFDVNRDGRPDLILLSTATQGNNGNGLQLLINHGNGTLVDETARLGPPVARLTGPAYQFVRFADFNGDGLEDFYLDRGNTDDGTVYRIWLNNGNGTLTPIAPNALPQDFSALCLLAVDFDGDRRPDILKVIGSSGVSISYRSFLNRTVLPEPPVALTATSAGSAVTLTWQAPTSGGPPLSYVIEAGTVPGAANLANFSTGNTLTAYETAGVSPGSYFVRVRATTAQGTSAASNEAQLLVASPCAPGAPGTPAVTFNSGGTVVLTWTAATGSPAAYIVEVGTAPGLSNVAVADVGNVTRLTATGVGNGTYYVRMKARNACGASAPSGELTLVVETPQAPGAPLGLTYQVSAGTVSFSWQAPAGVVDGYVVEAGSQPGLTNLAMLPVGNTTSFTVGGVPPGTYYVRVRAFNRAGQGPPSSEATVIVP